MPNIRLTPADVVFCEAIGLAHEATKRPLVAVLAAQADDHLRVAELQFKLALAGQQIDEAVCLAVKYGEVAERYRRQYVRILWIAAAWLTVETGIILWLVTR